MLNAINFKGNCPDIKNMYFNKQANTTRQQGLQHDVVEFSHTQEIDKIKEKSLLMEKADNTVEKVTRLLDELHEIVPVEYAKSIAIAQDVENILKEGIKENKFTGKGDETLREIKDGKLVRKSEFYDGILRKVKVYDYDDAEKCDMYVYFNAKYPAHVLKGYKDSYQAREYDQMIGLADCKVGAYEENARSDKNGSYKAVEFIGSRNYPSEYRENVLLTSDKFSVDNVLCFDNHRNPSTYFENILHKDGEIIKTGRVDLENAD